MANTTIGIGTLLIVLGVASYFMTGGVSITSLIPAFFGAPIAILGAVARNPKLTKHAMHGAVLLGLVGFLGSADGIIKLIGGDTSPAVIAKTLMAILTAAFVALCVKSFIDARKARASEG